MEYNDSPPHYTGIFQSPKSIKEINIKLTKSLYMDINVPKNNITNWSGEFRRGGSGGLSHFSKKKS